MAPHGWATKEQYNFLHSWIPRYIEFQDRDDLNGFWPLINEAWFKKWPSHDTSMDPKLLSDQDRLVAAQAILARRTVRDNAIYVYVLKF